MCVSPPKVFTKEVSPPKHKISLPKRSVSPPKRSVSPKAHGKASVCVSPPKVFTKEVSPHKTVASPKSNTDTPPRMNSVTSSPKRTLSKDGSAKSSIESVSPPKKVASPPIVAPTLVRPVASMPTKVPSPPMKIVSPPMKVASPPVNIASPPPVFNRSDSKLDDTVTAVAPKTYQQQRDIPFRTEKLSLATEADVPNEMADLPPPEPELKVKEANPGEESNGVGDKIKIFEKAAEDAATAGRLLRPGSMRRPRTERLPSDELPPPPIEIETPAPPPERHSSFAPQKIIRPEFRPLASPAEITIRSPSLGSKAPERFPSHGTAFRNVAAAPLPSPTPLEPIRARELDDEDDLKTCKTRRDRPAVSRGSSYFTRGSEEIWLVKKKDIEEIEERVLDSFRRAGVRGGASTTVRGRRGYARSESLEPTRGDWAGKAHTLKRQSSVACTCGHDKKTRARSHGGEPSPRPRSRSHGDPTDTAVLDKYETLV